MENDFTLTVPKSERRSLLEHITHMDKIPIIVLVDKRIPRTKKYYKFLVGRGITLSSLIVTIKRIIIIPPTQSVFFMSETRDLFNLSKSAAVLYEESKSADGFLYMFMLIENTFGSYV